MVLFVGSVCSLVRYGSFVRFSSLVQFDLMLLVGSVGSVCSLFPYGSLIRFGSSVRFVGSVCWFSFLFFGSVWFLG